MLTLTMHNKGKHVGKFTCESQFSIFRVAFGGGEFIHQHSQMPDEAEMSRVCYFNVCDMNMGGCKSDS